MLYVGNGGSVTVSESAFSRLLELVAGSDDDSVESETRGNYDETGPPFPLYTGCTDWNISRSRNRHSFNFIRSRFPDRDTNFLSLERRVYVANVTRNAAGFGARETPFLLVEETPSTRRETVLRIVRRNLRTAIWINSGKKRRWRRRDDEATWWRFQSDFAAMLNEPFAELAAFLARRCWKKRQERGKRKQGKNGQPLVNHFSCPSVPDVYLNSVLFPPGDVARYANYS